MASETRRVDIPWNRIVLDAEPDFYKNRKRVLEYDFGRRKFYADPAKRGVYGDNYYWEFSEDYSDEFSRFDTAERV